MSIWRYVYAGTGGESVRKFVKHILGKVRRSREQQPGVQTTNSTPASGRSGGSSTSNDCCRRLDISSARATSSDSAVVSEAVTEQVFGEHLLLTMRERRAMHKKEKFRDLLRRCQVPGTSGTGMTTQIKMHQAELHLLYLAYVRTLGIDTGTMHVHLCCVRNTHKLYICIQTYWLI